MAKWYGVLLTLTVVLVLFMSSGAMKPSFCWAQELPSRFAVAAMGGRTVPEALDPTLRKWYAPQELYWQYRWKAWEYSNYAKESYERYTDIQLEGQRWYDLYGNYVTKGFQIYAWTQEQPVSFGSTILKERQYSAWFDNLLIASDSKGQHHIAVTIGDQIRTTLTPLTFSKPSFNGLQWDYLSDKYGFTALVSRPSSPGFAAGQSPKFETTDYTNLLGCRGTVQLGDFVNVGVTYVNAHNGRADRTLESRKSLEGELSSGQNRDVIRQIKIRISDDSPEDGVAGGAFFSEQITINGERREDIKPLIVGGFQKRGYLSADGAEKIELIYDIPEPHDVKTVGFDLVLSNDYRVEATSNLQTNREDLPVYLLVARAPDNVDDNTNQRVVRFEYGLPTARQIYGLTLEVQDLKGFFLTAEYDVNREYRKFPNVNFDRHSSAYDEGHAFYATLSKTAFPWFVYGEFFNIDDNYRTSGFIVDEKGLVDYEDEARNLYELVDDNDDQDRAPDWIRRFVTADANGVFPGLDENNDLRSDFNQNSNLRPDYDEPFLRYAVDPPEFLFGMDMNNNAIIDRFEDDNLPDYPYKSDHRGYNLYVGVEVVPETRLKVGHLREWLWSNDARSQSTYGMFTFSKSYPGFGRLELFDFLKSVKDNIADDVNLWEHPEGTLGQIVAKKDPMIAQNTVVNTVYLGFDYTQIPRLNVINKIKYETYTQRDKAIPRLIAGRPDTLEFRNSSWLGLINKLDYTLKFGERLTIQPKAKSMYRHYTPSRLDEQERKDLTEMLFLISKFPIMRKSWIELGLEYTMFFDQEDESRDFTAAVYAIQFTNVVDYLGYKLTTNMGFEIETKEFELYSERNTAAFVKMYAGVGD